MSKEIVAEHSEALEKAGAKVAAAEPKGASGAFAFFKSLLPNLLPFLPALLQTLAPKLSTNKKYIASLKQINEVSGQLLAGTTEVTG